MNVLVSGCEPPQQCFGPLGLIIYRSTLLVRSNLKYIRPSGVCPIQDHRPSSFDVRGSSSHKARHLCHGLACCLCDLRMGASTTRFFPIKCIVTRKLEFGVGLCLSCAAIHLRGKKRPGTSPPKEPAFNVGLSHRHSTPVSIGARLVKLLDT